jgi:exopolyphosphatase / guanosine-5'-triphosphate,3'-diphosphate pyrophosphatase
MIFAAIDIGSNAGRLLIATVMEFNGKIVSEKISLVRVPLRLGMDVFQKGIISPEKEDMLVRTFLAYRNLIDVFEPSDMIACATAAMREALNASEVMQKVKAKTGIDIHIIDGLQEAEIISEADNTNLVRNYPNALYIDVGGGSTEISWYHNDKLLANRSFNMGSIRLLYNAVQEPEWENLRNWLTELRLNAQPFDCIASGGNINKLTKIFGNRNLNRLTQFQLNDAHDYLSGFTVEERINKLGMRPDRADVIVPAAYIFKKIMKWGNIFELQAPKIGLADGLVVELYRKKTGNKTVLF